jgi:hypothetical protein
MDTTPEARLLARAAERHLGFFAPSGEQALGRQLSWKPIASGDEWFVLSTEDPEFTQDLVREIMAGTQVTDGEVVACMQRDGVCALIAIQRGRLRLATAEEVAAFFVEEDEW